MTENDIAFPQVSRRRVLHVLKWLPRGGIETWLTHIFANGANGPIQHEVLLMQDEIGPYEAKVRAAGVRIHTLPVRGWLTWLLALRRFLRSNGPFAVVHSHVDSIVSGPVLAVAAASGVPVRIMHNHAAQSQGANYQDLRYKVRELIGTSIIAAAATRRIAISEMAMEQSAGARWRERKDCTILLYGFDYSHFAESRARADRLRIELGIRVGCHVLGHVGRFASQKNHAFLIDTFAEYLRLDPEAVLVLIGHGPLKAQVQAQVDRLEIAGSVRFAAGTDDIAAFMSLFDVFVFPSFSEGLGIVALEAQAAGTPVIMPENMPHEVIVIPEAVTLLPLDAGARAWAQEIGQILGQRAPDRAEWLARVEGSAFGLERCIADLNAIYREELAKHA
ncbi:glycosyltransferase [Parafrankia sp. BMG5.11]|uniref:glycosyltransferase n=1 Tax=Parafrankia sp. BMG5.11 TaxID=222540 RepID=UPI001038AD89|nr:glycosyltransferase [Parafrankia sp. BMG5.11]TCJ40216.1 glycosyltransferase [Parafrankia sp. BMG5.11]